MTRVTNKSARDYALDPDDPDDSDDSDDSTRSRGSNDSNDSNDSRSIHASARALPIRSTLLSTRSPAPSRSSSSLLFLRFPEVTSAIPWHSLTGKLPDSGPSSPSTTEPPLPFSSSFRFFSLPAEIRHRVYAIALPIIQPVTPIRRRRPNKSNPPQTLRRLSLFLVSKRFHTEASRFFYTSLTFRIFPLQDNHPLPTLCQIYPRYRHHLTSLELVLGSDWQKPPKSWRVTPALGLRDLSALRALKVFVLFDPSHPFFKDYRVSYDFYTDFCGLLLGSILDEIPRGLESVKFDANPGVELEGPLMSRLVGEVVRRKLWIRWGPERGWAERAWSDKVG